MKQKVKIPMKLFAFIMALLMLFVSLPVTAFASAINDAISEETNVSNSVENENSVTKKDVIVLEEDETLRDENTKHFKLSDGTTKAVVYSQAVHYKDADGKWVDIDNALTLNGSEYSSNNKSEIKFANKSGSTGTVSIKDGDYKIDFTPLNTNKVSVVIENPQSNNSRKFEDMSVLNNLVSKAIYADIYDGIDIEYILVGNNIKENIIVKEKQDSYTYSFELKLNKLSAELVDGVIILSDYDSGEQVYEIPVPYMFDANNVYSENVEYSLVQNNKWKYTFTVTADAEWINSDDRAFPVTIDPAIGVSRNDIVCFYETEGYVTQGGMVMHAGDLSKIYFKLSTLPELPNSAYISGATIKMYCNSGADTYIGAYKILNDWSSSTIKPSTINSVGIFSDSPVDYVYIEDAAEWDKQLCTWNIVDIVRGWYSDANYGVGFNTVKDTYTSATFSSMTYDTISCRPFISIEYRDMKGVESYWSYVSQNVGSAGKGVVNLATGNLMFEISTLTTTENIFGYTPSMIYNSAIAGEEYKYGGVQNGYWYSFAANGFKLNMNETLIKKSYINGSGETSIYYVWADADGTEHYFMPSTLENEENIYYDEDGLQLELVVDLVDDNEEAYCKIVDSSHSERIFYILGGAPSSEGLAVYHLEQLRDRNGNILSFIMDGAHKPNDIKFTPSGTVQTTQLLGPLYNSSGKVGLIWCNETKEGVLFRHSNTPTGELSPYGGTYLREALYLKCDSNISWTNIINEFIADMDNEYEGITVNGIMKYEYNSAGQLVLVQDTLLGYSVQYTYSDDGKVICAEELGKNNEAGQTVIIDYYSGYTEVRTSGSDDEIGTNDDLITVYVFDDFGRAISVYTTDVSKSEIYGATTGSYENQNDNATNNIKQSSVTGMTYANYIINGNFEYSDTEAEYWTLTGKTTFSSSSGACWDNSKLNLWASANNPSSAIQTVNLTTGKYTLSLNVNSYDSENLTIYLKAISTTETYIEEIPVNECYASGSNGFINFTFEVEDDAEFTVGVYLSANDEVTETDYITVDNIMLSKSSGSSVYNYLNFGSFENYDRNKIDGTVGEWLTQSDEGFWIDDEANDYAIGQKFGNSIKINGAFGSEITVFQNVYSASDKVLEDYQYAMTYGKGSTDEEKVFTLSGFGKATQALSKEDSTFALRLDITYCITGVEHEFKTESAYANFTPTNDAWQYASCSFVLPKGSMVKDITVYCDYSNNFGTAYFDNISLECEESSSTTQYFYYDNGMLKAVKNGTSISYYVYDENNNVSEIITNENRTVYTYNEDNNLVSIQFYRYGKTYFSQDTEYQTIDALLTSKQVLKYVKRYNYDNDYGLVSEEFMYDMSGEEDYDYIKTSYEYETSITSKIFGALLKTTDSLKNETQYFYDRSTGRLIAIVEDDNTGYVYTYDKMGRLIMTQPVIYSSGTYTVEGTVDVSYEYNSSNQLEKIISNDMVYSFIYDEFGNQSSISIGNTEIVNREYNSYNGKISKLTYANETVVEYKYDNLGRVSEIVYVYGSESFSYKYEYDSNGNLTKVIDGKNNKTTIYKYDNSGKLQKMIEYDNDELINTFGSSYSYDDESRLYWIYYNQDYAYTADGDNTTSIGNISNSYYYSYLDDGNSTLDLIWISIYGSHEYELDYNYDCFDRCSSKEISFGDTINNTISYGYKTSGDLTSLLVSSYTTEITKASESLYSKTFNYTYDETDKNITEIRDSSGELLYKYSYDILDRLIREDNAVIGRTYVYAYDDNSNILNEKIYSYTIGDLNGLTPITTNVYGYNNSNWLDQLTSYNGVQITYDEMGNPISYYNGMTFSWENINNLSSINWTDENNVSHNAQFTYNTDGIRTSKTIDGIKHTYSLDGLRIVSETYEDKYIIYIYDESNCIIGFAYRENSYSEGIFDTYLFTKNLQGDIIGIHKEDGTLVASYTYDAWGNHTVTNYTNDNIGDINPFRYRGYYFDQDINFYYLNSRYYDSQTKRFINADDMCHLGEGSNLSTFNLYVYCYNSPIIFIDPTGTSGLAGALFSGALGAVAADGPLPFGDIIGGVLALIGVVDLIVNGPAIEMPSISIPKEEAPSISVPKEESPSISIPKDDENQQTLIYRYGNILYPQASDMFLFNPKIIVGVSFSLNPPKNPDAEYYVTTIEALNNSGIFIAVNDRGSHVTVRPTGIYGSILTWYNDGVFHPYTIALRALCTKVN